MKALFAFILAFGLAGSAAHADPIPTIQGQIKEIFIGELDPFMVGDACIVFVQADRLYGLVGSFDDCSNGDLDEVHAEYFAGYTLKVNRSNLKKIRKPGVIRELKQYNSDAHYYYVRDMWDLIEAIRGF